MSEPYEIEREVEQLRAQLEYERRERYAAEMALHESQEYGRYRRPELSVHDEWEN